MWKNMVQDIAIIGITLALLLGLTVPAQAVQIGFECPVTIEGSTPAKRTEIQTLLPPGDALDDPDRLNASIDGLKRLGLSETLIVNHLIGAYCPLVARNMSLSDAEKTAKIRRFAGRIIALVYNEEDATGIFLDVLLKPSVVDQVNEQARKSGLSVQDWLSKAVQTALGQH